MTDDPIEVGAWLYCERITDVPGSSATLHGVTHRVDAWLPPGSTLEDRAFVDGALFLLLYRHTYEGEPVIGVIWEEPSGSFHKFPTWTQHLGHGHMGAVKIMPLRQMPMAAGMHRFRLTIDGVVRATVPVQVIYNVPGPPPPD